MVEDSSSRAEVCTVATDPMGTPRPFDVATIEHLIGLMARHELAEIALQEGDQRIRLRKVIAAPPPPVMVPPTPAPAQVALPAVETTAPRHDKPISATKLHEIKSEMVGTFYAKPKPDKDDYVKVGAMVSPDTVVCQIEAMKIFNEVVAGVSGTIVETCVGNGEPVEYGTVLFRVEPN